MYSMYSMYSMQCQHARHVQHAQYVQYVQYGQDVKYVQYVQLEIGGKEAPATPNREIGFSFVSCSCRACVRACEAVRVREAGVPNAGGSDGEIFDSGAGWAVSFFNTICVGF